MPVQFFSKKHIHDADGLQIQPYHFQLWKQILRLPDRCVQSNSSNGPVAKLLRWSESSLTEGQLAAAADVVPAIGHQRGGLRHTLSCPDGPDCNLFYQSVSFDKQQPVC